LTRRPCAQCGRNRAERFYSSARAKKCADCLKANRRATARRRHVSTTYGLTLEDHDRLLDFQANACAICEGERPYALNVDHDHDTGLVRGLLCRRCNKLLRDVRDDARLLENAVAYLALPPVWSLGIKAVAR
jgi:hypothetical protein